MSTVNSACAATALDIIISVIGFDFVAANITADSVFNNHAWFSLSEGRHHVSKVKSWFRTIGLAGAI